MPRHRRIILAATLLALSLAGLAWWISSSPDPDDPTAHMSDEEILAAAQAFYDSRPYYERPFPYSEVPEGLPDLRSETCGQCHGDIHQEWSISTHARAWKDDAQYMEELAKARGEYYDDQQEDYGWLCVTCHTPMINQLEELVIGLEDDQMGFPILVDNPYFDEELQDDAIGCATCHVEDGIVYGPRGDTDAPHPVAKDEDLTNERNCVQCHQAEANYYPDDMYACFFTTGTEWADSPAAEKGNHCQDCHMPPTQRPIADTLDAPTRDTRHHYFGGSLIPKHPDFEEEIKPLRQMFGSGATLFFDTDPDDHLALRVYNEFAGHMFPTGDPERHVEIDITLRDADGQSLEPIHQHIGARYQWYPELKLLSDNRIDPGDSLFVDIDWPDDPSAYPLEVDVEAHKYRMYQEDFDYHGLEGRYVRGRDFHYSTWTIEADDPTQPKASLVSIDDDWGPRDTLEPPTDIPSNRPSDSDDRE